MQSTGSERRKKQRKLHLIFSFLAVWFIGSAGVCLGAESARSGAERSRVYKTQYRTAEEIKGLLVQLGIGRRVDALSEKILIVTSHDSDDLIRASSILQMLDSSSARFFKQWPGTEADLPDLEYLFGALNLSDLQGGTLLDPPASNASDPVLLDIYEGGLLAIGSEGMLGRVEQILQQWTARQRPKPAAAAVETAPAAVLEPQAVQPSPPAQEPNQSSLEAAKAIAVEPTEVVPAAEPQEEDFFSRELMEALTAAQEKAAQLHKEIEKEKQTANEEGEEDRALLEIIEALRQRSEVEAAESPIDSEQPAGAPQVPTTVLARLEEQLARQEQQIAELKALLAERAEAKAEPKIRTAGTLSEPQIPEGETELELTITLPEKVEITSLLELVGKQLGLNYMYDPTQVRGDVQLKIHDGKIKVKDTYALLESVMRFKGFVMTRRGNLVTIVPASQIKQAEPAIVSPDEPIVPGDVVVSSVFPLKHISPATAQKMLTDLQLGTSFVAVNETNTLIVTDYSYRMERVHQVISLVDVAGEPKKFGYRQLQYTSAGDILNKLKNLTAQMSGITVAAARPEEGAPATPTRPTVQRDAQGRVIATRPQPTPAPAAAPAPSSSETIFLDTDERTNRILMIGYESQIQTIQELIDTLDVPKYYLRYVREYVIQHVEAAEVVTALNELGLASVSVGGPAGTRQTTTTRPTLARTAQPAGQPAQPAQPTVSPATSGGEDQPYISIRTNTNSLLVNATKDQHEVIEMVISHVDVKQKDQRTIQEYEIQNVDALSVVQTLEDLGIIAPGKTQSSQSQSRSSPSTSRQAVGAAVPPGQPEMPTALALPTIEGETVTELAAAQPQIAILESTNSLLVHATPRQHEAISLVIAHVDRTLERVSTPYVVYPLENQDPDELAAVLNELIQETMQQQAQKSSPDAKIQTAPTAPSGVLPTKEEERIRIISDPKTYSLIVYANKKNQQWVGDLIRELDQYRPQVLLDCTLVQVTKDDQFKYELDLIAKSYHTGTDDTGNYSFFRHGTTLEDGKIKDLPATGASLLDSVGFSNQRYAQGSVDAGQITAFFNSSMIQGLLTAMQRNQYGRIMARPKILVNDNQEGEIKTEEIQSVAQIKTNVIPGTATQTSTSTQEAVFNDYTAGVTLKIKPHISKGDMLRLEISLNRTDFGTSTKTINVSDGSGGTTPVPYPPDRTTTDITTVATIPDGTTIILGGLEKIKQNKTHKKVPVLGDLPLVGTLFRDVDDTDEQGKLYIFVKANILRPSDQVGGLEDIRRVSGKYRREFEEMEDRFQGLQDFPGIQPEPMNPRRVLEADEVPAVSEEELLY